MNGGPDKGRPAYEITGAMAEVVDAVGYSAATSLMHVYAGCTIYIPTVAKVDDNHPIGRLLGVPLARKLCQALGGTTLQVPTGYRMLEQAREAAILAALRNGATVSAVAQQYSMTERGVRLIAARFRATA